MEGRSGHWSLQGAAHARLQSELPSDFSRAVCSCRYVLGLVYPAYVTVNALESPGTQDDHHVRFALGCFAPIIVLCRCSSFSAPPPPPVPSQVLSCPTILARSSQCI